MTRVRAAGCAIAAALALGGCAMMSEGPLGEASPGVVRSAGMAPAQAEAQVHPGASSKADVAAALGRANTIAFDTGWEVWVYRWLGPDRSARSATELVIAFDPAGIARKVRVRPGSSG